MIRQSILADSRFAPMRTFWAVFQLPDFHSMIAKEIGQKNVIALVAMHEYPPRE